MAWQRDGFAMFEKLMDGIADDYLRYVFHVQVLTEQVAEPDLARASYQAADDPVQGDGAIAAAFAASPVPLDADDGMAAGAVGAAGGVAMRLADDGETQLPIVKSAREKIGRNEPCWCGSGKKFKLCHGAN